MYIRLTMWTHNTNLLTKDTSQSPDSSNSAKFVRLFVSSKCGTGDTSAATTYQLRSIKRRQHERHENLPHKEKKETKPHNMKCTGHNRLHLRKRKPLIRKRRGFSEETMAYHTEIKKGKGTVSLTFRKARSQQMQLDAARRSYPKQTDTGTPHFVR